MRCLALYIITITVMHLPPPMKHGWAKLTSCNRFKRVDVVLLLRGIIFCLEFKVGQRDALQADVEQVMDYALDLKNFHRFSHDRVIVPILIPTNRNTSTTEFKPSVYDDQIYNPLISGADHLQELITSVLNHANATNTGTIDNWTISPYTPTPTIIEAARALYENHSVEDITRHEADKVSTDRTISYRAEQGTEKEEYLLCDGCTWCRQNIGRT